MLGSPPQRDTASTGTARTHGKLNMCSGDETVLGLCAHIPKWCVGTGSNSDGSV